MPNSPAHTIIQDIALKITQPASSLQFVPVSGGSINKCYRVSSPKQNDLFLKVNQSSRYPGMFAGEAFGLSLLSNSGFQTPTVLYQSADQEYQYLLLHWINPGNKTIQFWKKFGEQLALLHQCRHPSFGGVPDNYIGSLPQSNLSATNWSSFFIHQRLQPQIKAATSNGYLNLKHLSAFDQLFTILGKFFPVEQPSLLHGDLWSGNYLCDQHSNPVLIDPAVYFGHRMMDISMTQLFGGFDSSFYDAYHYHYPLPSNFADQSAICQLYPLLVHLNLFGQSYLYDITTILSRYTGNHFI